eukprot:1142918-Pelagomonas_calceolata.AAC.4
MYGNFMYMKCLQKLPVASSPASMKAMQKQSVVSSCASQAAHSLLQKQPVVSSHTSIKGMQKQHPSSLSCLSSPGHRFAMLQPVLCPCL